MVRFQRMSLVIGVASLAVLGAGCCRTSRCRPRTESVSYAMMASTSSTALIRLVPIDPPTGQPVYPAGTKVDPINLQITFPPGSGPSNAWFAVELTGWGKKALRCYEASVLRSDPYCPRAPCDCLVGPGITACSATTPLACAEGSACESGVCATAFVNKADPDFVFLGKSHTPSVRSADPKYTFNVNLDPTEAAAKDVGRAFIGGTIVVHSSDICAQTTHVRMDFDSSSVPKFVLEGGSTSYPSARGAIIFCEN